MRQRKALFLVRRLTHNTKSSTVLPSGRNFGLEIRKKAHTLRTCGGRSLTLSLTGVGPSGPALTYMQISLKVQNVRYRQKLGIPQAGSWACFKIKTVPI